VSTKSFGGDGKKLQSLKLKKVEWVKDDDGKFLLQDSKGKNSEITLKADLVLLAMGFVHPKKNNLINDLGVSLDNRGNVNANDVDYKTNRDKVFVSGDMRRGQSLVVWAIREGRQVAHSVDKYLMGNTTLPY
jgi:glutamate synthase (NADPH/NADH) small chain